MVQLDDLDFGQIPGGLRGEAHQQHSPQRKVRGDQRADAVPLSGASERCELL